MGMNHFIAFWAHHAPAFLAVVVCLLSVFIVLGCAIASWIAPSEDNDCLFHRHVF